MLGHGAVRGVARRRRRDDAGPRRVLPRPQDGPVAGLGAPRALRALGAGPREPRGLRLRQRQDREQVRAGGARRARRRRRRRGPQVRLAVLRRHPPRARVRPGLGLVPEPAGHAARRVDGGAAPALAPAVAGRRQRGGARLQRVDGAALPPRGGARGRVPRERRGVLGALAQGRGRGAGRGPLLRLRRRARRRGPGDGRRVPRLPLRPRRREDPVVLRGAARRGVQGRRAGRAALGRAAARRARRPRLRLRRPPLRRALVVQREALQPPRATRGRQVRR
mmetsp:Transcript_29784/g.97388  ORF Transcript_29784/g.97388 Transcript_29784/m.97388 type:complete len:279 (+) Transcript_29784:230-1066(+)